MSLMSNLKSKSGSTKNRKRIGRGDSSGWGGTSGKGHKGQKARSGGKVRRGFEGGQMPLARRLPKFGFNNKNFRNVFDIITFNDLNKFTGEVTPEALKEAGISKTGKIKIIVKGELEKALTVKVHKISASAKKIIEEKGGKVEVVEWRAQ